MDITEVRVKLVDGGRHEKLKAFCSITIDGAFVVRDLKVIEGSKGLFVAMPSRKLTVRCPKCGSKNRVRCNYCAECGKTMPQDRGGRGSDGRVKLHADIAHPINSECREALQARVIEDFLAECDAARQPGYDPDDLEDYGEEYAPAPDEFAAHLDPAEGEGLVELEPVLASGDGPDSGEDRTPEVQSPDERGEGRRPGRSRRRSRGGRGRGRRETGDRDEAAPAPADREEEGRDGRGPATRDEPGRGRVPPTGERRGESSDDRSSPRRRRGRSGSDGDSRSASRDGRESAGSFNVSRKREKVVESSDPPPDDNFDVGIF